MTTFHVVLTTVLLLLPAVVTACYRPSAAADRAKVRRRRLAMGLATAGAFAVYGFLLLAESRGWLGFWRRIPWALRWSRSPTEIAWALQFVLWWPFGVRLLVALRPEAARPHPDSPSRTAALTPRAAEQDLPSGAFVPGWILVCFAAGLILTRALRGETAAATPGGWWPVVLCLAGAAFPLVLTPLVLRLSTREPEPLDPAASAELVDAYARLRRLKARAFAGTAIASAALFAGLAVAVAYVGDGATLGLVGGVGGTVLGLAGATFGIVAGNERMRIRRRLQELASGS